MSIPGSMRYFEIVRKVESTKFDAAHGRGTEVRKDRQDNSQHENGLRVLLGPRGGGRIVGASDVKDFVERFYPCRFGYGDWTAGQPMATVPIFSRPTHSIYNATAPSFALFSRLDVQRMYRNDTTAY
nr:hypothetical protein Iba_chr04dCG11640 [Ipomoea batatas]